MELKKGQRYTFDLDEASAGDTARVALPHPEVLAALEVGHRVLIDDGKLSVRVVETCAARDRVVVEVCRTQTAMGVPSQRFLHTRRSVQAHPDLLWVCAAADK